LPKPSRLDERVLNGIPVVRRALERGEEFNTRAVREGRAVPEQLREDYLKYRVNIRVLGVLRRQNSGVVFVPSHRRLPHVGSPVAFPSGAVLREIAGHNLEGVDVGFFTLGEYLYAKGDKRLELEPWMQLRDPCTVIKFPIQSLVSRRTFIFARWGSAFLHERLARCLRGRALRCAERNERDPSGLLRKTTPLD